MAALGHHTGVTDAAPVVKIIWMVVQIFLINGRCSLSSFWKVLQISPKLTNAYCLIKCKCCPHTETSQLIYSVNQLTGFYLKVTLAFNGLKMVGRMSSLLCNFCGLNSTEKSSSKSFISSDTSIFFIAFNISSSTHMNLFKSGYSNLFFIVHCTKKMKFSIEDFFSKCDRIRRKLRIWSHLLKKFLMKNFVFCAVVLVMAALRATKQIGL